MSKEQVEEKFDEAHIEVLLGEFPEDRCSCSCRCFASCGGRPSGRCYACDHGAHGVEEDKEDL